ncbi:MAG: hypothetical protein U0324_00845 [Polyangiales bacterium]
MSRVTHAPLLLALAGCASQGMTPATLVVTSPATARLETLPP